LVIERYVFASGGGCVFRTNRNAELLRGFSIGPDGVQFWPFVKLELAIPWFYLQLVEGDGQATFRSMMLVPSTDLLVELTAIQDDDLWIEQAQLVTPGHINNTGQWKMERLLELHLIRDAQGGDAGNLYRVEGGGTYSTSGEHSVDGQQNTELLFSAKLHLRS
jgi:hypothetical protein